MLVGAGGIGCELLKNLVKSGFKEIHIIDLDTIDLSNLNRQFLFRHEHIKKPKALVAKEVAQRFDPRANIQAHHSNIKDKQYNVEWFSKFDLVFNALDNLDARRHVNRMCLAADVPLIESGTTGYNGNVQVIKKGQTACYECKEKQVPKSFAVCTVRSTPSQPIHTIVWAKSYLLPELFGVSEDAAMDASESANDPEEMRKLKGETEALRKLRDDMGADDFAKKVFEQAYTKDVDRLLSMEDFWKNKRKPTPLNYDDLIAQSGNLDASIARLDQEVWSLPQTFVVFRDALARLAKRFADEKAAMLKDDAPAPEIEFDKDDEDTLDFVTAAANLRSSAFNIELKSKFDTKQMAGNIIPAIATTNAMTAALCNLQAYKVIKGEINRTRELFLSKANMVGDSSDAPNPDCVICSRVMLRTKVDFEKATLQDLVDIVKLDLGYTDEVSIVIDGTTAEIYNYMDVEDDPDAAAEKANKKLTELGVTDAVSLILQDEADDPHTQVQLILEAMKAEEEQSLVVKFVYKDGEKPEIPRKPKKTAIETNGHTDEATNTGNKRKREAEDEIEDSAPAKKRQTHVNGIAQDGPIVLDEDEDGAILIE